MTTEEYRKARIAEKDNRDNLSADVDKLLARYRSERHMAYEGMIGVLQVKVELLSKFAWTNKEDTNET